MFLSMEWLISNCFLIAPYTQRSFRATFSLLTVCLPPKTQILLSQPSHEPCCSLGIKISESFSIHFIEYFPRSPNEALTYPENEPSYAFIFKLTYESLLKLQRSKTIFWKTNVFPLLFTITSFTSTLSIILPSTNIWDSTSMRSFVEVLPELKTSFSISINKVFFSAVIPGFFVMMFPAMIIDFISQLMQVIRAL